MPDIVSLLLAPLVTGAIAGALINWILEQLRAKERRSKVLAALRAQLESLPRVNTHNLTATNPQAPPQHLLPIPYPTAPFEIAIFAENVISVNKETAQTTIDYLLKAQELNVLIETLHSHHLRYAPGIQPPENLNPTRKFLYDQASNEMAQAIKSLATQIQTEQQSKAK